MVFLHKRRGGVTGRKGTTSDNSAALVALLLDAYLAIVPGADILNFEKDFSVINMSDDNVVGHSLDPRVFNAKMVSAYLSRQHGVDMREESFGDRLQDQTFLRHHFRPIAQYRAELRWLGFFDFASIRRYL